MRVSGLASGMDIDSMVKQLMSARRIPLDTLNQNKQVTEWRRDNYKQVNSSLVDFRQNKIGNEYRKTSAMAMYNSEVAGDKEAISVRATNTTNMAAMKVEVKELATQRTLSSEKLEGATLTTKLSSFGTEPEGGYRLYINGKNVTFSGSDSIKDVIDKINGDSSLNANAIFDEAARKLVIKSKTFGSSNGAPGEFSGNLTGTMNFVDGQNAKVLINGEEFKPNSNTITMNGVEITLLKPSTEISTVTTKADGSKAIETIKSFIEDYNALIKELNSKISEKRYKNYAPLTSEQKKEMEEDDIKLWTEKAMSGLLRGDTILSEGLSNMRNILTEASVKLGDKNISLPDIGITTGKYTENGKLYLDEAKLQQAIADNPDKVMELFIGSSDGSQKGVFDKLYDTTLVTLGRISDKAGTSRYNGDLTQTLNEDSTMGKELIDMEDRITTLAKKLTVMENNYYTKFNAMEQAINKLNAQSTSITNMLAQ